MTPVAFPRFQSLFVQSPDYLCSGDLLCKATSLEPIPQYHEQLAFDRAMAGEQGQRHALFSYLIGREDGRIQNMLLNPETGALRQIDFDVDFAPGKAMDTWSNATRESLIRQATHSSIARERLQGTSAGSDKWDWYTQQVRLSPAVVRQFASRARSIRQVVKTTGLSREAKRGVLARLDVLARLAKRREPTLNDLDRLASGLRPQRPPKESDLD